MSINRVNISGNIGRDPELRSTAAGTQILTFTLAVNDRRKNPQSQQWEEVPNWIPCVIFGQRAQTLSNLLAKGMKCAIEGKLRWSQWDDKKTNQKRSKIEVIVDEIEFLSHSKAQNQPQQQQANNYPQQQQYVPNTAPQQPQTGYSQQEVYDAEIPF